MTESTSAHEELAWIRSLMEESQRTLAGTWRHQALWGVLSAGGLLGTWALLAAGRSTPIGWMWAALLTVGWAGSLWLGRRARGRAGVRSSTGRMFGAVWMGAGVTLTLIGGAGIWSPTVPQHILPGVLATVIAAGYFASGFLAGLGWLRGVAAAWWACGLLFLLLPGPWTLAAMAAAVLLLQVGPALALRRQARAAAPAGRPVEA